MNAAIRALKRLLPTDPGAVEPFLEDNEFPLQEGRSTTFVFHGPAEEVQLKHWIRGLATQDAFDRVPGTDLWYLTMDLPAGARIEYKFLVAVNGHMELVRDPLNKREAYDPFGANSVCYGPGYELPDWTDPEPDTRPGEIVEASLKSKVFGDRREYAVYVPASFRDTHRYPLLVVHDAQDYLNFVDFKVILDNLIERLEIEPMIVALTQSPARMVEYAADPRHAQFITKELLPRLEKDYPLDPRPAGRGLMGASFGAVACLSTAWKFPGVWGRLLLQSGSFAFTDIDEGPIESVIEPVVKFMNVFREAPGRPAERIYMSCGQYEPLIYENRSLVPLLQSTGMELRYTESRDGHNWQNWRDRLREALSYLYPGPLWMVYE